MGIDEAIRRGHAFAEAGTDLLFIESPESVDEMRCIASSFNPPVMANMVEGGQTPQLTITELQDLGFKLVIFPGTSTFITAMAVMKAMQELKRSGTTRSLHNQMMSFNEFNEMIGLPEVTKIENLYMPRRNYL
jgi:2-methylisocitrate lyase-like PEP mutase family enzyme